MNPFKNTVLKKFIVLPSFNSKIDTYVHFWVFSFTFKLIMFSPGCGNFYKCNIFLISQNFI